MSSSAPLSAPPFTIEYPETLPVSGRIDDIAAALRRHQVVVVCGETGSGKTTQLPKLALQLAAETGVDAAGEGRRRQIIGHTQPRRIAASSVAKRIADELHTPLGEVVGFKVRFHDRVGRRTAIKLMTDGILLAETQTDPLFKAYHTLIIDEAHERSLNIDFLLGHIRQILPRRPDLRVIVTSATIDAERFARHFASRHGDAPVIQVSGRTYPVELRWRPFEESRDFGLPQAIADGVDELWRGGAHAGDILVFLPGEREIRAAADHLRHHLGHVPALRGGEVLPLFARLSQAEQDRIFSPHGARRIVLATNVAETSLTVPGIRHVIDAGSARVKRYSLRSKVEQLLIEPISQAAANQRAGRCGRVAEGVCIRLYEQADFDARPRYTDPEILRSSLAGVILRMKALGLGVVEDFPFLEAPSRRAITDGYQLLAELGAVDEDNELTPVGRDLARLPLDPRVGRMLLAGRDAQALDEVLVIASALSVQDVRERPLEAQAAADQAHARFDDEKSEFVSLLKLWKWLEESKGGHGQTHKLSHRQHEQLLRQHYISPRRLREWRDIHAQLLTVATEHGWKVNTAPASYEQLHKALLAGLLGNVGCKSDSEDHYLGARGIKFHRHPGARLSKRPARWVVCGELVETARLYGRDMAAIEPQWLEQVAPHLLKKQLLDPHWEKKAGEVVALERATLYGLVVYSQRRVSYGRVDPQGARDLFIREALVAGLFEDSFDTRLPFFAANRRLIAQVQEMEHKSRRQDVLVDEALIRAYYDSQLPPEVCSTATLERWVREAMRSGQKQPLHLSRDELMRHEAAGVTTEAFPRQLRLGGVDCRASYLHEPGDARDGLTVTVPLFVLNQITEARCEWLVPGMLKDKLHALLKSLPQKPRARLVPLPQTAERYAEALCAPDRYAQGSLLDELLSRVRAETGLPVQRQDFKLELLGPHHFLNLCVVDEHGRQLGMGRNVAALKAELGGQARGAFQALASLKLAQALPTAAEAPSPSRATEASGGHGRSRQPGAGASPASNVGAPVTTTPHTQWDFGSWPELMEIVQGGQTLIGFPALIDAGDAVTLQVYDDPDEARRQHRGGLRRLFALQVRDSLKHLEKNLPELHKAAMAYLPLGTLEELRAQVVELALERAFLGEPWPMDAEAFAQRLSEGRGRLVLIAQEVARLVATVLQEWAQAQRKLKDSRAASEVQADVQQQLQRLVPKRLVTQTPWAQLQHLPRYLKGVQLRLDKWRADPVRDSTRLAELRPLEQRYLRTLAERKGVADARLEEYRWMLEELRIGLFAQELRTPQPVSVKRLEKAWSQMHA